MGSFGEAYPSNESTARVQYDSSPVAFELPVGGAIPAGTDYWLVEGVPRAPAGGAAWPDNPDLGPWAGNVGVRGYALATVDTPGGGLTINMTLSTALGVIVPTFKFAVVNGTDRDLTLAAVTGTLRRYISYAAPTSTVTAPTAISPTTTLALPASTPAGVVERKLLDKANAATHELTREEQYGDLGTVRLGHRVNLTADGPRIKLGMVGRGHIITARAWDWEGVDDPTGMRLTYHYTLEHIPGTVLPGHGTSSPTQDAAGTGAELSLYLRFDDATSGFDVGGLAA